VELRQYRHVLALADHASFRKASEALGISQPALTKSLFQIAAVVSRRPDFLADCSGVPPLARGPNGYGWRIPGPAPGTPPGPRAPRAASGATTTGHGIRTGGVTGGGTGRMRW
jgi:hypothetical protein